MGTDSPRAPRPDRFSRRVALLVGAVAAALSPLCTAAQTDLGLFAGVSFYNGELAPIEWTGYFQEMRPTGGVFLRRGLVEHLAFRVAAQAGQFQGADTRRGGTTDARNLSFRSTFYEGALTLEVYPFRRERRLAPYISFGFAAYHFNPTAVINGRRIDLQPLGTEGQGAPGFKDKYSRTRLAVPVGGGLHLQLSDRWGVFGELVGRATFFDYLDDVGGYYADSAVLLANGGPDAVAAGNPSTQVPGAEPFGRPGSLRGGSPGIKDYYYSGQLGATFRLGEGNGRGGPGGKDPKCYKF